MHPTPRRALPGTAAAPPADPARRRPAVPGDMMQAHMDGLPGIHVRAVAA